MKKQKMISVITVVYNCASAIEQTILSVLNQTYNSVEYIIVDGASTDGTLDIIKNYELEIKNGKFPNVSFRYISEPDKGIYDAMNKGIDLAIGEWVNFMNAGDVFNDNEVLQNVFCQKIPPGATFLYSDFMVEKNEKCKIKINASFDKGIILHQSVIYKKELHDKYGLYVVTSKIIISDYLFFNSIPREQIFKVDTIISLNSSAGVSCGDWCAQQKLALDYIFDRISFTSIFWKALVFKVRKWTKAIVGEKIILNIQTLIQSKHYHKTND